MTAEEMIVQRSNRLPAGIGISCVHGIRIGILYACELQPVASEATIVALATAGVGSSEAIVEGAVPVIPPPGDAGDRNRLGQGNAGKRHRIRIVVATDPAVRVAIEAVVHVILDVMGGADLGS